MLEESRKLRIAKLAAFGAENPKSLSLDEIRFLCSALVAPREEIAERSPRLIAEPLSKVIGLRD
jgi:hypothetical protein